MKGPKKVFPDMPFGNMDSEKIEARKGLLETFLKVSRLILIFYSFSICWPNVTFYVVFFGI